MLFKVLIFFYFVVVTIAQSASPTILYSKQSPFGLIEVVATAEPGVLKICENKMYDLIHSTFKQGDPTYLGLLYAPLVTTGFCFSKNVETVLLLGLGAGDFLSYMMKYFPDAKVDAVEINPVMIDIVKKFREKDMAKAPNYLREDGFKYVDKVTKKYDLIFCDMYLGKPSSSKKYNGLFKKIKNLLNEEGVFIWNAYFHFIPRVVAEDMLKNFENIVAAITTDGLNIVFICYQGPAKSKEELEKMAKDIQSKHNFRYSLTDQLQKFKLITPADHETWAAKFPVLE